MITSTPPASFRRLILTFVPPTICLAMVAYVAQKTGQPVGNWTRDVSAIAKLSPLAGVISNIGILIWCIAAAVCGFVAVVLYQMKRLENVSFLVASCLLSTFLLLDDFFLIHDKLAHRFLGLSEHMVYVLILLSGLAYLWCFRRDLFRRSGIMLFVAGSLLAGSVLTDVAVGDHAQLANPWFYLLEDSLKLLGICAWCSYFLVQCRQALRDAMVPSAA